MIPGIVVANALYSAYSDLGLLNSICGLILADSTAGIPFAILILRAFMSAMPASVVEAAGSTGPGPSARSSRSCCRCAGTRSSPPALFTFLFAWGDFLFALTLTTTEDVRPVTLGLYTYIGSYVNDWSSVMATAVLASHPGRRAARGRPAVRRRRDDRRRGQVGALQPTRSDERCRIP